ncbi:hypothetical protein [Streptomyces sp. NE5-10]|nr:hypothetical protein [Streptomyces sp. NE5-10]
MVDEMLLGTGEGVTKGERKQGHGCQRLRNFAPRRRVPGFS